jgi:pyruvate formate lyase activating enzyme
MVRRQGMTRRDFLKKSCAFCLGLGAASAVNEALSGPDNAYAAKIDPLKAKEAMFYRKIDERTVQCELCPRGCALFEGMKSFCRVREPRDGKLYTRAYGEVCSSHVDPIEKKPLFHFLPSSTAYSIATAGCNYRCKSCQNWQISQAAPEETYNRPLLPMDIVNEAIGNNCKTVAYTYTEPVIFYEYMLETSKAARLRGVRNMCHSNGSFRPEPLAELIPYLDAANIDLKGFSREFYTKFSSGYFDATLDNLRSLKEKNVWLEITNLIVPTLNDDPAKIEEMCKWVYENLGPYVPMHFTRFWP